MDYQSIHGPGISNFPPSSQHRLPTVSAAQALQELKTSPTRCISSGLPLLDLGLQNRNPQNESPEPVNGGVSRGKVTEVYGPPGVGKTALGMQLAANALLAGERVMWVDASHPLPGLRFLHVLTSLQQTNSASQPQASLEAHNPSDLIKNLHHFSTPTLAHILALFARQAQNNPPPKTSLIVIDSFSTLLINAFPRNVASIPQAQQAPKNAKLPKPTNPSARKFPILQHILGNLQKLAATQNIAIVIISQCVTKMRPGIGAVLAPSISSTQWEQGLACRVALFRDWGWNEEDGDPVDGVRLAQVIKAEGTALPDGRGWLAGFTIGEKGLNSLALPALSLYSVPIPPPFNPTQLQSQNPLYTPQVHPQKRKRPPSDLEIPDSEGEDDEDYGWGEEDEEEIPAMPPQWQGSEDILIPDPAEREAEADEEEEPEEENADGKEETFDQGGLPAEIVDSEDELAL